MTRRCLTALALCATLPALGRAAEPPGAPAGTLEADLKGTPGIVDATQQVPTLQVQLAYATADNFLGRNVYGELKRCYLHRDAAAMLAKAASLLAQRAPALHLLAYDCLRPRRVQRQMWAVVAGTPQQSYVADPNSKTGSIHNYGCAIDLTLGDAQGKPLEMGTPFDHFGSAAHPRQETKLVAQGKLSHAALANRLLLREVMVRAGFFPIGNEWWHFNCATHEETRRRFRLVE